MTGFLLENMWTYKPRKNVRCNIASRDFNTWISASMDSEAMWPGSSDDRRKRLCMRHLLPDDAQLHLSCTQIRLSVDQAGNVHHVWVPEAFNAGIQNLHPMEPVRRWDLASPCFKQAKSIRLRSLYLLMQFELQDMRCRCIPS